MERGTVTALERERAHRPAGLYLLVTAQEIRVLHRGSAWIDRWSRTTNAGTNRRLLIRRSTGWVSTRMVGKGVEHGDPCVADEESPHTLSLHDAPHHGWITWVHTCFCAFDPTGRYQARLRWMASGRTIASAPCHFWRRYRVLVTRRVSVTEMGHTGGIAPTSRTGDQCTFPASETRADLPFGELLP